MRPRQQKSDSLTPLCAEASAMGASYSDGLGDDLTRARLFCLKAGSEMSAIVEASREPRPLNGAVAPGRDPVWLCQRLSIIQREAKRARARAVYRSAQDVLSLIQRCNVHMPINWTRVDGRLFVLNKLLSQYEVGLEELENQSPPELLTRPFEGIKEAATPAFDPVHEIAKNTLSSLLPHAREEERIALKRLIEVDLTPAPEDTTQSVEAKPETPAGPDRVEWIMPGLVQDLMEVGREYGKLFSVSHTLDDVLIEPGTSENVRTRIFERLSDVVRSDLPLQGVGRLDISMTKSGLKVSGSGFEPILIDLSEQVAPSLEQIAQEVEKPASDPTRAPAPRITQDTEAELRTQLNALLGGLPDQDS